MIFGSIGLEILPSVSTTLIHLTIALLFLRKARGGPIFLLFFMWMALNSLWTFSHTLYWATGNTVFEVAAGILLPFSPTTMFIFSLSYPSNKLHGRYWLAYVLPALIWIPSALLGTPSVVGKGFGIFQMPYMLLMDVVTGAVWLRKSRSSLVDREKRAAFLMMLINIPALILAGVSYYVSYLVIEIPTYIVWFGDFIVGLASMQMAVLMATLSPGTPIGDRELLPADCTR